MISYDIPMLHIILVDGFKHFLFSRIYGIILPIDFHIFQRGRSTTNQYHITLSYNVVPLSYKLVYKPH